MLDPITKLKEFFCTKEIKTKTANEERGNRNSSEMTVKIKTEDNQKFIEWQIESKKVNPWKRKFEL